MCLCYLWIAVSWFSMSTFSQLYQFLFQQRLDSQEFDKNQNYQDRIISQSAVRITGFPLEITPNCSPLFQINPGYYRVFHKVSKQQQINCLPSRFLMTTLYHFVQKYIFKRYHTSLYLRYFWQVLPLWLNLYQKYF